MPNHVTTRLAFTGPDHSIAALRTAIATHHPEVHQQSHDGDLVYKNGERFGWLDKNGKTFRTRGDDSKIVVISEDGKPAGWEPVMREAFTQHIDFQRIIPQPPCVFTGDMSMSDEAANPGRNWYTWNSRKWGTKWNAYSTSADDAGRIKFDTAWAFPMPVITELSMLFPDVEITCETYGEGEWFWGTVRLKAGEVVGGGIVRSRGNEDGKYDAERKRLAKELKGWEDEE